MQVLVDGRPVYNPLLGGVYWKSLPVQIQDIDRIEIVRGPNAVLYGSNAGLGVINVITKKPRGTGGKAEAWGGTQGAVGTAEVMRWFPGTVRAVGRPGGCSPGGTRPGCPA